MDDECGVCGRIARVLGRETAGVHFSVLRISFCPLAHQDKSDFLMGDLESVAFSFESPGLYDSTAQ
jgi:hypothetical protein